VARDVVARTKCIPPVPPVLEGEGGGGKDSRASRSFPRERPDKFHGSALSTWRAGFPPSSLSLYLNAYAVI